MSKDKKEIAVNPNPCCRHFAQCLQRVTHEELGDCLGKSSEFGEEQQQICFENDGTGDRDQRKKPIDWLLRPDGESTQ